ncbi:hypothetical protein NSA50_09185 [Clostridium sp. DSM 100503]|uniref:hypothetical protein n=1 Tax=Clostridium sp. DSM 100503 TaxID=2963282 RepID=UPI00214A113E|nr:hypothetical protein [Clostridium sp. DSM 100503]MCR1951227.1 hypothetical protein [Clostridium sp. DSM 100503]
MNKKEILLLSKLAFDFILKLKDEDLNSLIKGEKKITLIDNKKNLKGKKINNKEEKVEEVIDKVYSYSNKDEALEYLNKFNVIDLKKIANQANVYIKSRNKKSEIIDRIVEGTIGAKIKMGILQY